MLALYAAPADAGVAVVANRTAAAVELELSPGSDGSSRLVLEPGDARPIEVARVPREALLLGGPAAQRAPLAAGEAYEVVAAGNDLRLTLRRIDFGATNAPEPTPAAPRLTLGGPVRIRVKAFVDEDEVRRPAVWEAALRTRLEEASAVLDAHAGVTLEVASIGTWNSDNGIVDFNRSLREFEEETRADPADLAIGFTSQYQTTRGRYHMGGTRGPLRRHLLVKERARGITENERLELLLHELGHYLGAGHSAESASVMRPLLHRGPQRQSQARLQFDPANTLLMGLVAEELRTRRATSIEEFSPSTRRRMNAIYGWLERALPEDPAATQIQQLLASAGAVQLLDDVRHVVERIVAAGELTARQPQPETSGDVLAARYVRAAAAACREIEPQTAPQAFCLALGIALDDTELLRSVPPSAALVARIEDPPLRNRRRAALGRPELRGRVDLARHFFVAAHAAAFAGGAAADAAGLAKELLDSRGGSGFSFADMAANRAGIAFARAVLTRQIPLESAAESFTAEAFMPAVDGLPEGLSAKEFAESYGGPADPRYRAVLDDIDARIRALHGHGGGAE